MRKTFLCAAVIATIFLNSGCAMVQTTNANLDEAPDGYRIVPKVPYLFVTATTATLVRLDDFSRAYDVNPVTVLAKQDFKLEFSDGELSAVTNNHDSTAILTFLQGTAEIAAGAIGGGVSGEEFGSNLGFAPGIYRMNYQGAWVKVRAQ